MTDYKVIVLDDDPDIHNLLSLRFKDSKFELVFVETLEEAKIHLIQEQYACMLLDIVLRDNTSSIEIINLLKGEDNKTNDNLPLIVMSSHIDETYGKHIQEKEPMILNTLSKPIGKEVNLPQLVDDTIHAAIFLRG